VAVGFVTIEGTMRLECGECNYDETALDASELCQSSNSLPSFLPSHDKDKDGLTPITALHDDRLIIRWRCELTRVTPSNALHVMALSSPL